MFMLVDGFFLIKHIMVLQFGGKFGNLGSHLQEIIATGQQLGENLWILPGQIIEEKGRFSWGFFHVGFITIYNPIIINANWIEWEAYKYLSWICI